MKVFPPSTLNIRILKEVLSIAPLKNKFQVILLLAGILLQIGCNKSKGDDTMAPSPLKPVKEKRSLITNINTNDESFSYTRITYDSLNRIVSFTGVPGDYNVYYLNDTIHHILSPVTSFNGLLSRTSWIFIYGSDKKCTKVVIKHVDSYNGAEVASSNPIWAHENDGQGSVGDSLVYSSTGQLAEIWQNQLMFQFKYDDLNAVTPSKIYDCYDNDGDHVIDEIHYQTSLTYTDIEQPASKQLWFFPFVYFNIPVCPTDPATSSRVFLVLLKKGIKQYSFKDNQGYSYTSQYFEYGYNADSTSFYGMCTPDDITYSRFDYTFSKQ